MGNQGIGVVGSTIAEIFNRLYCFRRAAGGNCIKVLQPGRPPRVLCDEVVRKIAQQLEAYSEEDDRHFLELKFILNRDESDYAG